MLTVLKNKLNDEELDHKFKAKLLKYMHNKPINHTYPPEKFTELENILNDQNLSLLPASNMYKAEVGKPAWDLVYKIATWKNMVIPEHPTMDSFK